MFSAKQDVESITMIKNDYIMCLWWEKLRCEDASTREMGTLYFRIKKFTFEASMNVINFNKLVMNEARLVQCVCK